MASVVLAAAARAVANRSTLVFKADPSTLTPKVAAMLLSMGTQAAATWRENTLDHVMCRVLGCTEDPRVGHTTLIAGKPQLDCSSSCCAEQSQAKPKQVAVWLNASQLVSHIHRHGYDSERMAKLLRKRGWPLDASDVPSSGSLYPNRSTRAEDSVAEWQRLIASLGVYPPDENVIRNYLIGGLARRAVRHKAPLRNERDVRKALRDAGPEFEQMLSGHHMPSMTTRETSGEPERAQAAALVAAAFEQARQRAATHLGSRASNTEAARPG